MNFILILPTITFLITIYAVPTASCQEEPLPRARSLVEDSPAPRAEPVKPEEPVPRAQPVPTDEPAPRAEPVNPQPTVPGKTDPQDTNSKTERAKNLIDYANYVYSQQQWELAASYYEQYLNTQPQEAAAASAWYRLGESLLKQKKSPDAEKAYLKIIGSSSKSKYLTPAAYRLGSIYFSSKQYDIAAPYFKIAKANATKKPIQLSATYYHARCLKEQGATAEMLATYEELAAIKANNPYREAALLTIARIYSESEQRIKAIETFIDLSEITNREDIKAEALVKSGLMSSAIGDETTAKQYLIRALELKGGVEWKPDAQFHLIKTYYAEKDYEEVATIYAKGAFSMSDTVRPKMLLMVGNAYRKLKRHRDAISVYIMLREHYPASKEASESEYRKLLSIYNLNNKSLPEFVDNFVEWQNPRDPTHKNIDMALLLKAEHYFARRAYGSSGTTYDTIRIANLPNNLRASTLYKRGWAHTESKNHSRAIIAFSEFITKYPDEPRIPNALAKRALNYRAIEDYTSALQDLNSITDDHSTSEAAELALQQSALINGQQRNYPGMVENYTSLIEKFPNSNAISEAYFWIGWGQFELKNFTESVAAMHKARELNNITYFDRATLRIILAEYSQQKVEAVRAEIEALNNKSHEISIPPQIYLWLGVNLFDSGDYDYASRYLGLVSNPEQPEATQAVVWKHVGQARLYTGEYKKAITAFDFYLDTHQPSNNRARVLHDKAAALLALKEFAKADGIVEKALSLQPQSRVYGMLCLMWGEIALQQEQFEKAIQRLIKPTYAIEDEKITPPALLKSALAHEKIGQQEKATELRSRLKSKFPNYKAETIIPGTSDSTAAVTRSE